tara:strand:+ start:182 stop:316 length:135 start_codon:yes stop_codon:yes gene_type:complete
MQKYLNQEVVKKKKLPAEVLDSEEIPGVNEDCETCSYVSSTGSL